MADDDADFVSELLAHHCEGNAEMGEEDTSAADEAREDTGWDDLIAAVLRRPSAEAVPAAEASVQAQVVQGVQTPAAAGVEDWTESSFGSARDLVHIGTNLQKHLFDAFRWAMTSIASLSKKARDKYAQEWKRYDDYYTEAVCNKTLRSRAALAERLQMAPSTAASFSIRVAACLVYAAAWLIGAFLSCWCRLLDPRGQRGLRPVAVVNAWKYDETPLRLSLQEWQNFTSLQVPTSKMRRRSRVVRGLLQTDTYCHAKIFATEWQYGFLSAMRMQGCSNAVVIIIM